MSEQSDHEEPLSGCPCVVCVTSRANLRQSDTIKRLTAERDEAVAVIGRVRALCENSRIGIRRVSTIMSVLDSY